MGYCVSNEYVGIYVFFLVCSLFFTLLVVVSLVVVMLDVEYSKIKRSSENSIYILVIQP